jgi:hypothetical protein
LDQVVPRLRPGGRKKLRDGFETQGTVLLFRHFDGFTVKRKLLFQRTILFTLIIQGTEITEGFSFFAHPAGSGMGKKNTALRGWEGAIKRS